MSIAFLFFFVGISLMLLAGAVIYYATYAVRSQWFGTTDWHGREDTGAVALTFDDGPTADTQRILDILAERNVCATFFMIGRHVEDLPQTARRVAAEGHEIGNHSYSHPIYLYRGSHETRRQLKRAKNIITGATAV